MKARHSYLCILFLLTLIISGCTNYQKGQNDVEDGLNKVVDQLPDVEQLQFIDAYNETSTITAYGVTCYYGDRKIALGTSLSDIEALEHFTEALLKNGWRLRENMLDIEQMNEERTFLLEPNAKIIISTGRPGPYTEERLNYDQIENDYPTILIVGVKYILPDRDKC